MAFGIINTYVLRYTRVYVTNGPIIASNFCLPPLDMFYSVLEPKSASQISFLRARALIRDACLLLFVSFTLLVIHIESFAFGWRYVLASKSVGI